MTEAEVTITPELTERIARVHDIQAELAAMRRLSDTMTSDPSKTFDVCTELALELCGADTCGISLREHTVEGDDVFRWIALSGQLKQFIHGTMPRHFSPCGVCVDRGEPVLMRYPEKFYKDLDVGTPFQDVLLVPLADKKSGLEGTLWIVSHSPDHKFDAEDCRIMQRIAVFTGAVLSLAKNAVEARGQAADQALRFQELDHRIKNALMSMSGMVRYQLRNISDPEARAAIEMATGRVLALGQVHRFSATGEMGDLVQILESVCANLRTVDPRFDLKVSGDEIILPAQTTSVVALMMNELIANSVKHAFAESNSGTISVLLRNKASEEIEMEVTDDGAPLTTTVAKPGSGIGLDLISKFAKQLGGEFVIGAEPKRFTVTFPRPAHVEKRMVG